MSTKDWIVCDNEDTELFQEMTYGQENNNPATIQIKNPTDFIIESESNTDVKVMSLLRVEIPAERFDVFAIAWLKHRKLSPYQFTLEQLLEKCEDGQLQTLVEERLSQAELEVNLDEHELETSNDIETADKYKAVSELMSIFLFDSHVTIEDMKLEFENLFNVICKDKKEEELLKRISDMLIAMREVFEKY